MFVQLLTINLSCHLEQKTSIFIIIFTPSILFHQSHKKYCLTFFHLDLMTGSHTTNIWPGTRNSLLTPKYIGVKWCKNLGDRDPGPSLRFLSEVCFFIIMKVNDFHHIHLSQVKLVQYNKKIIKIRSGYAISCSLPKCGAIAPPHHF